MKETINEREGFFNEKIDFHVWLVLTYCQMYFYIIMMTIATVSMVDLFEKLKEGSLILSNSDLLLILIKILAFLIVIYLIGKAELIYSNYDNSRLSEDFSKWTDNPNIKKQKTFVNGIIFTLHSLLIIIMIISLYLFLKYVVHNIQII